MVQGLSIPRLSLADRPVVRTGLWPVQYGSRIKVGRTFSCLLGQKSINQTRSDSWSGQVKPPSSSSERSQITLKRGLKAPIFESGNLSTHTHIHTHTTIYKYEKIQSNFHPYSPRRASNRFQVIAIAIRLTRPKKAPSNLIYFLIRSLTSFEVWANEKQKSWTLTH